MTKVTKTATFRDIFDLLSIPNMLDSVAPLFPLGKAFGYVIDYNGTSSTALWLFHCGVSVSPEASGKSFFKPGRLQTEFPLHG
jgi:hypothetical protein